MRKCLMIVLSLLGIVAIFMLAASDSAAGPLQATKHDFSSTGPSATFKNTANSQCNTCHTPHRASNTQLLWNHTLSSTAFTWGDTTVGGTIMPTTFSGTTKHCLSCHDGTVAVGDVVTGTKWSTTNTITGNAKVTGASNSLSGNHPVGVPYPTTGSTSYNGVTLGSGVITADYIASPTGVKIYAGTGTNKGIECASCHNPHDSANAKFLRVAAGSICASCHNK